MTNHAPVMLAEVLHAMEPRDGALYIDGTFGAGGYTRGLLGSADCRVLGIDRDPTVAPLAADMVKAFPGRFQLVRAPFSAMEAIIRDHGGDTVDGVVLDIGVSSMQIDQAERGFSFAKEGPLDMRMSGEGASAADAVRLLSEKDLADIFFLYGEERKSRRVAGAIVRARAEAPITTTEALAEIVARAIGGKPGRIHPATRVFQALRIFINDELGELVRALTAAERILAPMGRLVVVTFHSLEDRIVKAFLRDRSGLSGGGGSRHAPEVEPVQPPSFSLLQRKAVEAGEAELNANPRARSARLRAAIRTQAPVWPEDTSLLPAAPSLAALEAAL